MGSRAAPDLTRVALQQAQKSAEALFETKSVADIKKVWLADTRISVCLHTTGLLVRASKLTGSVLYPSWEFYKSHD